VNTPRFLLCPDPLVFLVCHFTLTEDRLALVRAALPAQVGLDTWYDATPLGYDTSLLTFETLENRTLHLARQHRFVIKDKLLQYDMFVNFEDDMLIKGSHVNHFVAVSEEIARLRENAPDELPEGVTSSNVDQHYHGQLTKQQLKRMIPGLIRVEVLLEEGVYGAQTDTGPVPVDLRFGDDADRYIDPTICCHVSKNATISASRPSSPTHDKIFLWETHILPLGVRQMPNDSWLGWVVCTSTD
jgi:hypothetical protein